MSLIDHIDGTTSPRRVYLDASTIGTSVHPIDLYREMRSLRRTDETLRKFDLFMSAFGSVPKGGGKFTERYVRLNDCRIIPFDTGHTITITGTLITDDGLEGVLAFDTSTLSSLTSVNINYVPPQVEVVTVAIGSGVTAQDKIDIANQSASAVWAITTVSLNVVGTIGHFVSTRLLTLLNFLGYK